MGLLGLPDMTSFVTEVLVSALQRNWPEGNGVCVFGVASAQVGGGSMAGGRGASVLRVWGLVGSRRRSGALKVARASGAGPADGVVLLHATGQTLGCSQGDS